MRLQKKHLSNKARSKRSEKRAAQIHKGRIQPASGALPVARFKGDIVTSRYVVDDKTTNRKSFAINADIFRKLRREAWINDRLPMIRIEFQNLTLCVIEEKDFTRLHYKEEYYKKEFTKT